MAFMVDDSALWADRLPGLIVALMQRGAFLSDIAGVEEMLDRFLALALGRLPTDETDRLAGEPHADFGLLTSKIDLTPKITIVLSVLEREGVEADTAKRVEKALRRATKERNKLAHSAVRMSIEDSELDMINELDAATIIEIADRTPLQRRTDRGKGEVVESRPLADDAEEMIAEAFHVADALRMAALLSRDPPVPRFPEALNSLLEQQHPGAGGLTSLVSTFLEGSTSSVYTQSGLPSESADQSAEAD